MVLSPGVERRGPAGEDADADGVDLDERIAGLNRRIERLGNLIDSLDREDVALAEYTKLVHLYGQLCSRLGRLLRDRQQLLGSHGDEMAQAVDEALDATSKDLQVDL